MMSSRSIRCLFGAVLIAAPCIGLSEGKTPTIPEPAAVADIVFLGEQHDNPEHHKVQARWVKQIEPSAIVFEMLTVEQAAKVADVNRQDEQILETVLKWNASGWPDFEMYFPIFSASGTAHVFGASVPRDRVRALMQEDLANVLGAEAAVRFGLNTPLSDTEQTSRETLQRDAHCDALPEEMLPMMVNVQRLRDASLASAALEAMDRFGPPVVVITGNGHARDDWGAPYLVRLAAPEIKVFTLGQGEAGQTPSGGFSAVVDGPAVDRGDPCDAFQ